ncbi:hypothetical protein PoB_007112800 [Plakobranchus ocellatus]|uniref:Uncharacterized protein n=1 Tax=Plakobranchus ocellatus TaxID=259542 RepID=A0AAV4DK43_9GAST|nr:hypothetical protein PoB_007112800 [Plakobranchus ocellatus]
MFFCDRSPGSAGLHETMTLPLDFKVCCHAQDLNDSSLLRKLKDREAKYYFKCVTTFYRRKPKLAHEERQDDDASTLHATAFAELSRTSKALGMIQKHLQS